MLYGRVYPKCGGMQSSFVPGGPDYEGHGSYIKLGLTKMVSVNRCVCLTCGYCEEYVDQRCLEKVARKYGTRHAQYPPQNR